MLRTNKYCHYAYYVELMIKIICSGAMSGGTDFTLKYCNEKDYLYIVHYILL
jgi:hypothetical protein